MEANIIMTKDCKNCNRNFETKNPSKKYCSKECFKEYRLRPDILKITIEKRKKYNIEKYGVDNPAKLNEIKEKTKQTCLKKYGVISPTLVSFIHEKQIKTNIKKYGVKNPCQNEEIQRKQKNTLFKNYGVTVPLKNELIKEKLKQTNINLYGIDNPAKLDKIKEKTKQTCLKKYGEISPSINSNVKKKQIETNIKKYGVEFVQQNKEIKNKSCLNHKITYYKKLFNTDRLHGVVVPLFSLDEYIKADYGKYLKFQCTKCKTIFEDSLIHGNIPRCIKCFPLFQSESQKQITEYIKSIINDKIIENDKSVLNDHELDIFIPSYNLAIEFNGLYWHSEIGGKKYRFYHVNKTRKCKNAGIKLIHIFEDEWINKKEIVKSRIQHFLKQSKEKIFARKCTIQQISSKEINEFLQKYHLQGKSNSSIRLGAFYKQSLIAVMSLGVLRLSLGNNNRNNDEYEIYRFCTNGKSVVGIASKLLNHFIKQYSPKKIITYADKRWSDDKSFYSKLGFKLVGETLPGYWYIHKNNYSNRIHRFNFSKHTLRKKLNVYDEKLTEWENMQLNGYDRIWDCGNLKYEWIPPKIIL